MIVLSWRIEYCPVFYLRSSNFCVMSLLTFFVGVAVGLIFGAGLTLFYIQRKMQKQLGMFENEMEDMLSATQEMEDMMGGVERDVEDIDIDEVKEDKED